MHKKKRKKGTPMKEGYGYQCMHPIYEKGDKKQAKRFMSFKQIIRNLKISDLPSICSAIS